MSRRLTSAEAAEARDARFERAREVETRAGWFGRRRARRQAQNLRAGVAR